MSEPTTAAGRALVRRVALSQRQLVEADVANVEQEARAALRAELTRQVDGMVSLKSIGGVTFAEHMVSQEAVLHLLRDVVEAPFDDNSDR